MAHGEPKHLLRLTLRLISECSAVFVHIDAKSDISAFKEVFDAGAIPVRKRSAVYWGGWSQVVATLGLCKTALNDPRRFTHFALISGVDYPLARPAEILKWVTNDGREQITCVPMPAPELHKDMSRLAVRRIEGEYRQQGLRRAVVARLNRLLKLLPDRDIHRCLRGLKPHAGSNWWILTRAAIEESVAFQAKGGSALRLFKTSHCPDESFFQTVLAAKFDAKRFGRCLTYADWNVANPPAVLNDTHIDQVTEYGFELSHFFGRGPCLFIRKFPVDRPDLADRVDKYADTRMI